MSRARTKTIVEVLTRADADLLRERPAFVAGKYALMARSPFAFFRGSLALFLEDWNEDGQQDGIDDDMVLRTTRFSAGGARPFGLGDAHPENFGTMRSSAGVFRLEPNDFDTADLLPYLWDVRRFAVGICLAARSTNPAAVDARAATAAAAPGIVRAAMSSYAQTIQSIAAGGAPPRIELGGDNAVAGSAIIADLFERALNDWDRGSELDELGKVDEFRTLIRGPLDPAQPEDVTRDLPARALLAISATLGRYRAGLFAPPPTTALLPLDAVQELGQGIGSFPRMRALVLVRGPSTGKNDDIILEVKELPPQNSAPLPVPTAFASPQERIMAALSAGWTERTADPLWGVSDWLDFPVQVRTISGGFKTLRVARFEAELGTEAALSGLGVGLAQLIARMHGAPLPTGSMPAVAIADEIAHDPTGFVEEQVATSVRYCERVISDAALFQQALRERGPTLGVTGDPQAAATPELRILFDPTAPSTTPGVNPAYGSLTINEIAASGTEFVEIVNTGTSNVDLSEVRLADSDKDGGPRLDQSVKMSGGPPLAPGERVAVVGGFPQPLPGRQDSCMGLITGCYQSQWDIAGSRGETIYLLSADDVMLDRVSYPADAAPTGQSWARVPDGAGEFAVSPPSPSAPNPPL